MSFNILRAGHIEFRVTDLDRAYNFYINILGLVETERDATRLYLRGWEEREHHSLILRQAESAGVSHLAFRVATEPDLTALADVFTTAGLPMRWVEPGEERGQGRALRVQDPNGLPVEFYHSMASADRLLQRFDLYRGPHIMRLDHFNCQVPHVQTAFDWYHHTLGFWLSEYTVTDDTPPRVWATWLHRKQNVHDIALMSGVGPRLHHAGFWMNDALGVIRACDILAAAGYAHAIERGPGRHGLSNAMFLYLRDPDGNRIELYTGDYLIADPDWDPIRWSINDPRRATFWGHAPPASWFNDAALVENILTGVFMPTLATQLPDRPDFVT